MRYDISKLSSKVLLSPVVAATAALVRLDERVARSSIKDGWIARAHFGDAVASVWLDGELVLLEDLVLHDAAADVRTPTHELTIAREVLRTRRKIAEQPPGWALSSEGLAVLRGGTTPPYVAPASTDLSVSIDATSTAGPITARGGGSNFDVLEKELADMDAVLARSAEVLSGVAAPKVPLGSDRSPLVYEPDWNEDERLEEWRAILVETEQMPPLLRAVILLDAWDALVVLEHGRWLGRLLAASLLREVGIATCHLPALNVGLKSVARDRRTRPDPNSRILALLEAICAAADTGLREHDRLLLARQQLQHRLHGRRQNSKLPQLIELVLARPMVSSGMIAAELGVTPQGALKIARELNLRELTGRGRFRAWGIV